MIDREQHTIPFLAIQTWDALIAVPSIPAWSQIYPITSQSFIAWTGYTTDWRYIRATIKANNWTLMVKDIENISSFTRVQEPIFTEKKMDVVWWFTSLSISSLTVDEDSSAYWDGSDDYLRDVLFTVDEYPNIRFVHKAHTWSNYVIGDLTITDITQQVMFPMNFSFTWNTLIWDAYFIIDRYQRWLDGLDGFLDPYLEISLHFVWERIVR